MGSGCATCCTLVEIWIRTQVLLFSRDQLAIYMYKARRILIQDHRRKFNKGREEESRLRAFTRLSSDSVRLKTHHKSTGDVTFNFPPRATGNEADGGAFEPRWSELQVITKNPAV